MCFSLCWPHRITFSCLPASWYCSVSLLSLGCAPRQRLLLLLLLLTCTVLLLLSYNHHQLWGPRHQIRASVNKSVEAIRIGCHRLVLDMVYVYSRDDDVKLELVINTVIMSNYPTRCSCGSTVLNGPNVSWRRGYIYIHVRFR